MKSIATFLAWICGFGIAIGGEERTLVERYTQAFSAQQHQRAQLLETWSRERAALVRAVLTTLRDPATGAEQREHAARIAGLHRLAEAVDVLIPRLSVVSVLPIWERTPEQVWPYYGALLAIGSLAPERTVAAMKGGEDDQTCQLVAMLLKGIDGPIIADFRLERAIEDAPGKPEVQKTLKAIRAKLKTMH